MPGLTKVRIAAKVHYLHGSDQFGCTSVCAIDVSEPGSTFRCAQNPCDGTVSCGCATPLRDEKGETCALVSGFTLTCAK